MPTPHPPSPRARRAARAARLLIASALFLIAWRALEAVPQGPSSAASPGVLADETTRAIDALFTRWDAPGSPGAAIGVVRGGRLVYGRGFGLASLEHGVPVTTRSPFYIASTSKQFTAACAALLAARGSLDLDAPVRRYLSELRATGSPGRPLTVRHLLNHSGGVREWSSLALFAGHDDRFEQRLDNADLLRLLARQQRLEFEPGSRFSYSGGGYQLLTAILERVSGRRLRALASELLFQPLGMRDTFVDDDYTAVVPGRVDSYRPSGPGRYERRLKHFDAYGDGGIVTTVDDLARWAAAFAADRLGAPGVVRTLTTPGRLAGGAPMDYAFGLQLRTYRGHAVVEHGGDMLGFTSAMAQFPEDDLTVIVLANTPEVPSVTMTRRIADLLLFDGPRPAAPTSAEAPRAADAASLRQYIGTYWCAEANFYRRVRLDDGRLVLDAGEGTGGTRLVGAGRHAFVLADQPSRRVVFDRVESPAARLRVGTPETGDGFEAERYDPTPPASLADLAPFLGVYRSDELATTYRITAGAGAVTLQIGDGRPLALFPTPAPRVVWNAKDRVWIGFGELILRRDADGRVTALTIGDSRVTGIVLRKVG